MMTSNVVMTHDEYTALIKAHEQIVNALVKERDAAVHERDTARQKAAVQRVFVQAMTVDAQALRAELADALSIIRVKDDELRLLGCVTVARAFRARAGVRCAPRVCADTVTPSIR